MQPEETVQIRRIRLDQRWAVACVFRSALRLHHVQPVHRPAQDHHHKAMIAQGPPAIRSGHRDRVKPGVRRCRTTQYPQPAQKIPSLHVTLTCG